MSDKVKLLIIMGIPLFVMLAATFVYKTGIGIPQGTRNLGELVLPPQDITKIEIYKENGEKFDYSKSKLGWKFLIPGRRHCDEACKKVLWTTRQIHIALGRKGSNITRYYLNVDGKNDDDLKDYLAKEHTRLETLYTTEDQLQALLKNTDKPIKPLEDNLFFLVDPHGWVMMYYSPRHKGHDTITDMKFLLKQTGES